MNFAEFTNFQKIAGEGINTQYCTVEEGQADFGLSNMRMQ